MILYSTQCVTHSTHYKIEISANNLMSCEIFPPAMPDIRNGCVYTLGIGDTFSKPYLLFNYKNPRKALSKMNDTMLCYIKMII